MPEPMPHDAVQVMPPEATMNQQASPTEASCANIITRTGENLRLVPMALGRALHAGSPMDAGAGLEFRSVIGL